MKNSKKKATEAKSSDLLNPIQKRAMKKATKEDVVDPEKLQHLEAIEDKIRHGIITYYETAMLLQSIYNEKLYKIRKYKSFSEYCNEVFHFSRSYGYRLIAYSRVLGIINTDASKSIPERAIRALAQLKNPDAIQETWNAALSNNTDTIPDYQKIEELVQQEKLKQLTCKTPSETAAPHITIRSLSKAFSKDDQLADNIIAEAKGKLRQLLLAVKEVKTQGAWDETIKNKLKDEITKLQQEQLEKLFAD